MGWMSEEILDRILEVIEESDVKLIVGSSVMIADNYIDFINKYKENPNIAGWDFRDKPRFNEIDSTAKRFLELKNADSTRMIYINFVGSAVEKFTGDLTYDQYLDTIQEKFAPGVWSYDQYPISIQNGKDAMTLNDTKWFYSDFKTYSNISKLTGRPFWAYCQSMAFKVGNTGRPAPKEEYLRYEAFSALACGAQGIVYWTYALREDQGNEEYTTALIDSKGEKTEYWYYAQKVNNEIRKYNHIFLGSELVKIGHTGILNGVISYDYVDFGPLKFASSSDEGAMITLLKNGNKNYLVIVNHSPFEKSKIDIAFKEKSIIRLVNPIIGLPSNGLTPPPDNNTHTLTIPAGGYFIYEYRHQ